MTPTGALVQTSAVILQQPKTIDVRTLALNAAMPTDVVVGVEWTGISTGTERLLYDGTMPPFPGMGYPLVPGYEAVGRVIEADAAQTHSVGQRVFVPGAQCFVGARGLFGASASRLVVPAARVVPCGDALAEDAVLLALAAAAFHTFSMPGAAAPELIVGHGVLGRLLARIVVATGAPPPVVWEIDAKRAGGGEGYAVLHPDDDPRRDYRVITDVSGDSAILDSLVGRLAPGGEIVLAGFYKDTLGFAFAPAFVREARLRVAAQWQRSDLEAVTHLAATGALSLAGLITHRAPAEAAADAYATALGQPDCLKMVLDWRRRS